MCSKAPLGLGGEGEGENEKKNKANGPFFVQSASISPVITLPLHLSLCFSTSKDLFYFERGGGGPASALLCFNLFEFCIRRRPNASASPYLHVPLEKKRGGKKGSRGVF